MHGMLRRLFMKRSLGVVILWAYRIFGFGQARPTTPPAAKAETAAASAPTKNPVTASLGMLLPRSQNNIVGAIEAMPASVEGLAGLLDPPPFAHMVVHIAAA